MRGLAGEQLLTAWERSRALPEQEAALALLEQAQPERRADEWALMPLSERNALLLELRAATLGRRMEGFAVCPDCGAQLEFAMDARELARGLRAQAEEAGGEQDGLAMRPANTLDLLASGAAESEEEARSILLARTAGVEATDSAGAAASWIAAQPAQAVARMAERFEALNAAAEIRVRFECVACGSRPWLDLDIVRFLQREISAAARRLMAEIHELALAYGWSEAAIAAMSTVRRAAYLEMLGA